MLMIKKALDANFVNFAILSTFKKNFVLDSISQYIKQ